MAESEDWFQQLRDVQAEMLAGADAFDRAYYRRFGRFPAESELTPASIRSARKLAAIQALIEHGATSGERAAAQAAMQRVTEADVIGDFPAAAFEQDDPNEED